MNDAMMQHNDVQNAHGVLSKKEGISAFRLKRNQKK